MPQIKPAKPRDASLQERLRRLAAAKAEEKAAEEAAATACKRNTRRKSTALPALITFPDLRTQVPCTVADMSATGARLTLPHATAAAYSDEDSLPSRLTLVLRADRVQIECEVKWRRATGIGVRFLGPPKPLVKG